MQSVLIGACVTVGLCALNASSQEVQWATNYYSVSGTNLAEVHRSIRRSRPWKNNSDAYGVTEWRVDWRFDLQGTDNGCRVQRFTTKTSIKITLPRWAQPTNAEPGIREVWNRYMKALEQHEGGHAQIGLAAAAEIRRKAIALSSSGTCDALKQTVNDSCSQALTEYRKKDEHYDRQTEHGATQGARLPEGRFRGRFRDDQSR